jgi:hypothetical protein
MIRLGFVALCYVFGEKYRLRKEGSANYSLRQCPDSRAFVPRGVNGASMPLVTKKKIDLRRSSTAKGA